jgi:hypothetical protein
VIVGCRLLPFLPGGYDSFAVPLAGVAHGAGLGGLLLVPIGALWVLVARRRPSTQHVFAIVAMIAASAIALLGVLMMSLAVSVTLGAAMLALWAFGTRRTFPAIRRLKDAGPQRLSPAPSYLVIVPLLVASLQYVLVGPAAAFSRERAIRNSAELLADIEAYHKTYGRYPASLLALHQDYRPSILGIERFYYEPNGEAFNLFFEHPPSLFAAREIVMFNKRDEHYIAGHDGDRLLWTREQQLARRSYFESRDTPVAHWKSFFFD